MLAFLNYLKGCGFFRYGSSRDGHHRYVLVHSDLAPPERKLEQEKKHDSEAVPEPSPKSEYRTAHGRPRSEFVWKKIWPDHDEVSTAVTKWLSRSQRDELTLLYVLYECRDELPSPAEFALMMQDEVPLVYVLPFLSSHGFIE